jgi:hypothetical protein
VNFSANLGAVDSLNVRMRCGASWWASRIRCTERRLTPAAFASIRPVQWVASPGGGPSVSSTTLSTVAVGSGCLPGLRVWSRVSPSMPSAMNRACHRHTTGFDLPDRRMISAVPQPSAVARMMLARQIASAGRCDPAVRRLEGLAADSLSASARMASASRPGNHLTGRFPLIVETFANLRTRSRIIDGESVACDDNGLAVSTAIGATWQGACTPST